MHLLDHVLNEIQLKVVLSRERKSPCKSAELPESTPLCRRLTLKCNFSWLFGLENGGGGKEREGPTIISRKWQHNHITLCYKHAGNLPFFFYISCVKVTATVPALWKSKGTNPCWIQFTSEFWDRTGFLVQRGFQNHFRVGFVFYKLELTSFSYLKKKTTKKSSCE